MSLSADQRTRSCATELVCHAASIDYPFSTPRSRARTAARASTSTTTTSSPRATSASCRVAERPLNIWHFEELLPIVDAGGAGARSAATAGYTPLIHADRLGAELGLRNLYLKDD